MTDCTSLAADLAQAFAVIFDLGTLYGAFVFIAGVAFGSSGFLRFLFRLLCRALRRWRAA